MSQPATKERRELPVMTARLVFSDHHIKQLFDLFKWDKNTLLIITSDHGEGLLDHGVIDHAHSLYREEIQVPLMFYLPGKKVSKKIPVNVSTIDILPTILDFLGESKDLNFSGKSLIPLISNKKHSLDKRYIYSHLIWKKVREFEIDFKSVIHQDWHFITGQPYKKIKDKSFKELLSGIKFKFYQRYLLKSRKRQLFNLKEDFKEKSNINKDFQNIAKDLNTNLNKFIRTCKKYAAKKIKYKIDKEKFKRLKSLGYIN